MRAVFKDDKLEKHFVENGYCQLRLLEPADLKRLEEVYNENRVEEQATIERTTGTKNHELSRKINLLAGEIVNNRLRDFLVDYRPLFSGFLAKIPGKPSRMRLHQDPTFVDESRFIGLNVWCPLIDVNEENGALWIVEHSDKFFNGYRGQPARELEFDGIAKEVMSKMGKIIPMVAGEALIYDTRLFHFSLENTSGKTRLASTTVMIPKEATPIYYHHNAGLNTLDVYEMNEDFMVKYYSEYLVNGVVEAKLLSRGAYTPARKVSFEEFEEKYLFYNSAKQNLQEETK